MKGTELIVTTNESLEYLVAKYVEKSSRKCFQEIVEFFKNNPHYFTSKDTSENELLDTKGVMELLRVSRQTVYNWRKEGILKAKRKSGRIYFFRSDVLSFQK